MPLQCAGGAGGDQPMADEPSAGAAAASDWQWEDLSARHAGISLPHTLDLLKTMAAAALPDTDVKEVVKEVRQLQSARWRQGRLGHGAGCQDRVSHCRARRDGPLCNWITCSGALIDNCRCVCINCLRRYRRLHYNTGNVGN